MNIDKWMKLNTKLENGTKVAISGSTGGLGEALCEHLLSLGCSLVFLNRNVKKSQHLISKLTKNYPNADIKIIQVDMQDLESVKDATEELKKLDIDVLLINAGAYKIPRSKTKEGFDNVFAINFVSPYYMIREMLPCLQKRPNARVIVMGSIAHNYSKINLTDIDFLNEKKPSKVYGNAKRFLMFSLYELFKYEKNVKLSVVHPGITYTNITSHYPKVINVIIKYPMKLVFMSTKKASLSAIYGLNNETPYHSWIGPKHFNIWGYPKKQMLKTCSAVESNKIGQIAEEIYNKVKTKS